MAERKGEPLPEDVGTDDCLTSYTHIYSPDLLKYVRTHVELDFVDACHRDEVTL